MLYTKYLSVLLVLTFASKVCNAQGTLNIGFDGPPLQAPGTAALIQQYSEDGFSFTPLKSNGFVRQGGGVSFYPEDGSVYLQAGSGSDLVFTHLNGTEFSLFSVDLAEYSTVVPDAVTVSFIGYHPDGSTITTSFTTDGIIDGTGPLQDFQTFNFGSDWTDLTRVEIPTAGWSLDNLVVAIPEPSTNALFIVGTLIYQIRRMMRKKQL